MDALRNRLRARAEAVVALVETVVDEMQGPREEPLTPADGWKAVRLMRQADAMVCQLYATPDSAIRPPAPVKATSTKEAPAEPIPARTLAVARLSGAIDTHSRSTGFWPSGQPVEPGEPAFKPDKPADLRKLAATPEIVDRPIPADADAFMLLQLRLICHFNASTRHAARHSGHWPDGSVFDPEPVDYGYYSISESERDGRLKPGEAPGPPGLPWWVVRKTSPPG